MDPRLKKLELKTSITALADFLLPRSCLVCSKTLLPQEKHLCLECLADLPLTHYQTRSRNPMADLLNAALPDEDRYAYASALFFYSSDTGYDKITQALKYKRNFSAGKYFSKMLAERIKGSELYKDVDMVVPVPLHWLRLRRRGYNQAEIIASKVAEVLGVPCARKALKRARNTGTQTKRSASQRARNMKGAFRPGKALPQCVHILLVDDVFTTGATTAACLETLRKMQGPQARISVATLAFVE